MITTIIIDNHCGILDVKSFEKFPPFLYKFDKTFFCVIAVL